MRGVFIGEHDDTLWLNIRHFCFPTCFPFEAGAPASQ